jgi:two-component system phosphate regulon sensor histidine kinase PhoR
VSFAAASIGGAVVLTVLLGRRAHAARLQSDLLGNVSHELKTPLSAIRLYAQTLQSGLVDADPSSARACADAIARETEWLGAMIDRLLTWRGVARDREDLAMETGPLTDVVDEVASRFARMLPPGEVEFTTQVSTSLPVRHDRSAISSILLNLLTNAYKYTGSPKRISMCVEDGEGEVVLSVRDNGIGIPEREHKRIFQPFHRVDSELAGRAGGAGLGLAIAGVLVRGHHGSIVVDSEVGRGSTFKVSLPVAGGPH